MTRFQDSTTAIAGGALAVPLSRMQLFECVIAHFNERLGGEHKSLLQVEYIEDEKILRAMSTEGNVFAQVEQALNAVGVTTDGTMGRVMDVLDLNQDDVHELACECHSPKITSLVFASRLAAMARKKQ